MNFQNDETNGHVHVIHQINHTKMIVVIPKSTQRIDFTMTLIKMNGYTPEWAHLKWLLLNPCPPRSSSFPPRSPSCSEPWHAKPASQSQTEAWPCPMSTTSLGHQQLPFTRWAQGHERAEDDQTSIWNGNKPPWLCLCVSEESEKRPVFSLVAYFMFTSACMLDVVSQLFRWIHWSSERPPDPEIWIKVLVTPN